MKEGLPEDKNSKLQLLDATSSFYSYLISLFYHPQYHNPNFAENHLRVTTGLNGFLLSPSSHPLHRRRELPLQVNHQHNTPSSTISEMKSPKLWFSLMDTLFPYVSKGFVMSLNSCTAPTASE
jgi:hypothetical protein